jgi:hypothetical protein
MVIAKVADAMGPSAPSEVISEHIEAFVRAGNLAGQGNKKNGVLVRSDDWNHKRRSVR